jgi:hypothetical protein
MTPVSTEESWLSALEHSPQWQAPKMPSGLSQSLRKHHRSQAWRKHSCLQRSHSCERTRVFAQIHGVSTPPQLNKSLGRLIRIVIAPHPDMTEDPTSQAFFERKYRQAVDPWGCGASAYEHARYTTTIKALGDRKFSRGFEPGCSIGVLTDRIAKVCDRVFLAVHWLGISPDHRLSGDRVREILSVILGLQPTDWQRREGFRLDCWNRI